MVRKGVSRFGICDNGVFVHLSGEDSMKCDVGERWGSDAVLG